MSNNRCYFHLFPRFSIIKNKDNYHEILGVSEDATEADITKQYRRLAKQFHPDKNRAPGATEAFKGLFVMQPQPSIISVLHLTNRFHVAVCLFSNRSQMTSKCGKNKTVARKLLGSCATVLSF